MANKTKAKKRLKKAVKKREKLVLAHMWRNIFVKSGYLKG